MNATRGHVYDYPGYYDLIFGADWRAEYEFLSGCFQDHARRSVRRLFEPACGTGRLLVKFAEAGYEVAGNDLNAKAVAYCNARLKRHGFEPSVQVGDMSDFKLSKPVDAAFNMINSFRHLLSEDGALAHLRCMAEAIALGGIYVLGFHLTPPGERVCDEESWTGRRGRLKVVSKMWSIALDKRRREERVGMCYQVNTGSRRFRLEDEMRLRTYTASQFRRLLDKAPRLRLVETYDFGYDLDQPIRVGRETEDVVFVLRRE